MTKIFTFLVGQSCRSALNSWAAQQRRPTDGVKIFVLYPPNRPALLLPLLHTLVEERAGERRLPGFHPHHAETEAPHRPRRRRFCQSWPGGKMPSGVMIPVINSGGVTSKPGLRAPLEGLAIRT